MPFLRRFSLPLLLVALLAGPQLAGCAGAPLQEMSDARQAVRAAQRAGAQKHAPEMLAEAEQLVERARLSMQQREYREAREEAVLAREKAIAARRIAETASTTAPEP